MVAAAPKTAFAPDHLPELGGRRIAVVGADGFIGSHVVRLALRAGAEVEAVVLQQPWRIDDLDDRRLARTSADRLRLGRPDAIPPLRAPDAVVWLAYVPPGADVDVLEHERRVNTAAAIGALQLAAPVVFASSADVYGPAVDGEAHEDRGPAPVRPYAVAKLEAEEILRERGPVLRLATVFGPGENGPRAIPAFLRALLAGEPAIVHGAGDDVRDYVHVADVATAFLCAAAEPTPGIVNVGSGMGRTTLEVLEAVAAALGVPSRVVHVESPRPPMALVLATDRLRRLGVTPRTDLRAPLAEEAAWLRAHLAGPPVHLT